MVGNEKQVEQASTARKQTTAKGVDSKKVRQRRMEEKVLGNTKHRADETEASKAREQLTSIHEMSMKRVLDHCIVSQSYGTSDNQILSLVYLAFGTRQSTLVQHPVLPHSPPHPVGPKRERESADRLHANRVHARGAPQWTPPQCMQRPVDHPQSAPILTVQVSDGCAPDTT